MYYRLERQADLRTRSRSRAGTTSYRTDTTLRELHLKIVSVRGTWSFVGYYSPGSILACTGVENKGSTTAHDGSTTEEGAFVYTWQQIAADHRSLLLLRSCRLLHRINSSSTMGCHTPAPAPILGVNILASKWQVW